VLARKIRIASYNQRRGDAGVWGSRAGHGLSTTVGLKPRESERGVIPDFEEKSRWRVSFAVICRNYIGRKLEPITTEEVQRAKSFGKGKEIKSQNYHASVQVARKRSQRKDKIKHGRGAVRLTQTRRPVETHDEVKKSSRKNS